MSKEFQVERKRLIAWFELLKRRLAPACEEIEIAGSYRRQSEYVSDVEFVILPRFDLDLFENILPTYSQLDKLIDYRVQDRMILWDEQVKRNGPRQKRFIADPAMDDFPGLPIEMYIADAANYGNTLAIRTGDSDFNKMLIKPAHWGGLLPDNLIQSAGHLYRFPTASMAFGYRNASQEQQHELIANAKIIPCRTEEDFFRAIGMPFVEPAYRNESTAREYRRILYGKAA